MRRITLIWGMYFFLAALSCAHAENISDWQLVFKQEDETLSLIQASKFKSHQKRHKRLYAKVIGLKARWLAEDQTLLAQNELLFPDTHEDPHSDPMAAKAIVVRSSAPSSAKFIEVEYKDYRYKFPLFSSFEPLSVSDDSIQSIERIHTSGADKNRLVLVFLSEGYTTGELPIFSEQARSLIQAMSRKSPWDTLLYGTNIYKINVSSSESGVTVPEKNIVKNTYFQASFQRGALSHLLTVPFTGLERAMKLADQSIGIGVWDHLVILANTEQYGGSGGTVAVVSRSPEAPQVFLHELGHSFAGLADEYSYSYSENSGSPQTPEPNVDTNFSLPKWQRWISPGTPLPTILTEDNPLTHTMHGVGAYEGARYREHGIYRPSLTCAMREIDAPFCPVCQEAHLKTFLDFIRLADTISPRLNQPKLIRERRSFAVKSAPFPELTTRWKVCNRTVALNASAIEVSPGSLRKKSCQVEATLKFRHPYLKTAVKEYYRWRVKGIVPARFLQRK